MQNKPSSSDRSSLEDATTSIQFLHMAARPTEELTKSDEKNNDAADNVATQGLAVH